SGGSDVRELLPDAKFCRRKYRSHRAAPPMNFYWASAGSFVFFITIGLIGGNLLHLEGPRWYFFLGLMSALGLSSAALFYYFQRRAEDRRQSAGSGAGTQGASAGVAGANEADPLIRDANARLAQSNAGAGLAHLP